MKQTKIDFRLSGNWKFVLCILVDCVANVDVIQSVGVRGYGELFYVPGAQLEWELAFWVCRSCEESDSGFKGFVMRLPRV